MRSLPVAVSAALVALVTFAVATPAAADEGDLYTAIVLDVDGTDTAFSLLADDGTVAPFAPGFSSDDLEVIGVEVFGGQGYYLANLNDGDDDYLVGRWDVTTGIASAGVPIDLSAFENDDFESVDAWGFDVMPDGTILVLLTVEPADGPEQTWIASVDPDSGAVTQRVALPEVFEPDQDTYYDSLATDPITGTTFVLIDDDANTVSAIPVDVAGASVGTVVEFGDDAKPDTWMLGADFDATGVLWYLSNENESGLTLSSLPGPGLAADWTNGTRTVVVVADGDGEVESLALATWNAAAPVVPAGPDAPAAPELAATGVELSVSGGVASALLAAGVVLLAVRRRSVRAAG